MKNILFGYLFFAILFYLIALLGYFDLLGMDESSRQTFILLANLKWLNVIGAYIAWRVTP